MSGSPTHFEIGVASAAVAKTFYGAVLGWTFHPMGGGEEAWIDTGAVRGGLHETDATPNLLVYFSVADLDAALTKVRELGGQPGEPSQEEPGFGRFAECRDSQGLRFGLHQPSAG